MIEEKRGLLAANESLRNRSDLIPLIDERGYGRSLNVRITEEESEISHYSNDSKGNVQRKLVRKSEANVEDL